MKEVIGEFGGAAIAAVVAIALMFIVSNVHFAGGNGVSCVAGEAVGDGAAVLQSETSTAFDEYWRMR